MNHKRADTGKTIMNLCTWVNFSIFIS